MTKKINNKDKKNKPGVTKLKIALAALVWILTYPISLRAGEGCDYCGFFGAPVEGDSRISFIIFLLPIIPVAQLIIFSKINFKHWILADVIFYLSLVVIVFASLVLALVAGR